MDVSDCVDSPVEQQSFPLFPPQFLVRLGKPVEISSGCGGIIHPTAQQLTAIDEVDGKPIFFVFVREIAPEIVSRPQPAEGF